MRSRNGNRPFVFTTLTLIASLALGADEYYIGYRLVAKNAQPINEELAVSKAMRPCSATTLSSLTLIRTPNESLDSLLQREQTAFLEFAALHNVHIKNNETLHPLSSQSINTLTIPSHCYVVEFNNELVTITLTQ
ncbi:hypothetical protein [Sulfuricurvum sp.]|uniref:hypothetical protein n=1 Tax=Sulfuricurvum sp. TaxID=2025608 RepID=UPI0019A1ED49|nr:hypothetical protein [Sulfuricurvum sp.]MBD3806907.1 hypothetical protein [Sulfuricurvum sp.]